MLDNNFFRSSFMRHKMPATNASHAAQRLFSNGTRGIEPLFGRHSPFHSAVSLTPMTLAGAAPSLRHSSARLFRNDDDDGGGGDSNNAPTSGVAPKKSPSISAREDARRFSSATPTMEFERSGNGSGVAALSSLKSVGMVRNVPIQMLGGANFDANDAQRKDGNGSVMSKSYNAYSSFKSPSNGNSVKNVQRDDSKPTRAKFAAVDDSEIVPILSNNSSQARKFSASPRVTFSSDVDYNDSHSSNSARNSGANRSSDAYGGSEVNNSHTVASIDSSARLPYHSLSNDHSATDKNTTVTYRTIPIIQKISTSNTQQSPQQVRQQQPENRSNGNENYYSNGFNGIDKINSASTTVLNNNNNKNNRIGSSGNGASTNFGAVSRSVNNTPTPRSSALGMQRPLFEYRTSVNDTVGGASQAFRGGISSAKSTPSLFHNGEQSALSANENAKSAQNEMSDKSSEYSPPRWRASTQSTSGEKRSLYPSFLRRTQTAHAISPSELPPSASSSSLATAASGALKPKTNHFSMPSAAALNAALNGAAAAEKDAARARHSLHETNNSRNDKAKENRSDSAATTTGANSNEDVKSAGSNSSLTSLLMKTSKQQQIKSHPQELTATKSASSHSPTVTTLRFSYGNSRSNSGNGSNNNNTISNGKSGAASGGTASAKVKLKKASFVPPCIRSQKNNGSDEEDRQINSYIQRASTGSNNNAAFAEGSGEKKSSAITTSTQEPARTRSLSLSGSSLRILAGFAPKEKEDPVEEAIRSLETFDPNAYINANGNGADSGDVLDKSRATPTNQQQRREFSPTSALTTRPLLPLVLPSTKFLKSPSLVERSTLSPTTDSSGIASDLNDSSINQRVSTISSSSVSSNSVDAPTSSSSGATANATDTTLSSSDVEASLPPPSSISNKRRIESQLNDSGIWLNSLLSPQPHNNGTAHQNPLHNRNKDTSGGIAAKSYPDATASSSGSTTPTFARSLDNSYSNGRGVARGEQPQPHSQQIFNRGEPNVAAAMGNSPSRTTVLTQAHGTLAENEPYNHQYHVHRAQPMFRTDEGTTMNYSEPVAINENFDEDERFRLYDNYYYGAPQSYSVRAPSYRTPFASNNYVEQHMPTYAEDAAAADAEAHLRKRFLCSQLTDCAKVVEINSHKMQQFTAASPNTESNGSGYSFAWRQPHILRHNLPAIRDTMYTIEFALDELVEALARVSIDSHDTKYNEFRRLCAPLHTSQNMIRRLRANVDATSWALAALARTSAQQHYGSDALDQFVILLKQLPKDCYKLVQWVYQLGVWNADSGSAIFLSTSNSTSAPIPPPPAPTPMETQFYGTSNVERQQQPHRQQQNTTTTTWFSPPAHNNNNDNEQRLRQQYYREPSHENYSSSRSTTPSRHFYDNNNNSNSNMFNRQQALTTPKPTEQQQLYEQTTSNNNNNNKLKPKSPNTVRFSFDNKPTTNQQQNQQQLRHNDIAPNQQQFSDYSPPLSAHVPTTSTVTSTAAAAATAADTMDGGESTTSSSTAEDTVVASTPVAAAEQRASATPTNESTKVAVSSANTNKFGSASDAHRLEKNRLHATNSADSNSNEVAQFWPNVTLNPHSTVYEEDDLMSVVSESVDSLYGDNEGRGAYCHPQAVAADGSSRMMLHLNSDAKQTPHHHQKQVLESLSEEEKELLRFHEPQLDSLTVELCRLIEEFFNVIEERQNAKVFVQKMQMICIKAQTLVCIARMVARDDACLASTRQRLRAFLDGEANRLDALLNECIANARIAREKTESVPAVQAMVSSVVGVSQAALNLKQFWKKSALEN